MIIEEQIIDILEEATGHAVTKGTKIDSLDLDSLEFLQLVVDIDTELEIKIPLEQVTECDTVQDLINLVKSLC